MANINSQDTKRRPNESFEDYKLRICENMQSYGLKWEGVADVLNSESSQNYTESKYRKEFKSFTRGRAYERKHGGNDYLIAQARELERQRLGLSEQRSALRRALKDDAQKLTMLEEIRDGFKNIEPIEFVVHERCAFDVENILCVCLSDAHIGMEFHNSYSDYSSEIAKERLEKYARRIIDEAHRYRANKCVVALLGDLISGGAAHQLIRVENRENCIEQIKVAGELIAQFLNAISVVFDRIDLYSTPGNHSRYMAKDKDAIVAEAFDSLIPWYLESRLGERDDIVIHQDNDPAAITTLMIGDRTVGLVHGHLDQFSENGVAVTKLNNKIGQKLDIILTGHLHEFDARTILGTTVVRSGALCGTGDEYTNRMRFSGSASQAIVVFDKDGDDIALINVKLD